MERAVEVIDSGRLRKTPLGASLGFSRDDRDTSGCRLSGLASDMCGRMIFVHSCAVDGHVSPTHWRNLKSSLEVV